VLHMDLLLLWLGRAAGIGGALLCVFAVIMRLRGNFWTWGFELGSYIQVGTAAMVFGCFCLLAHLTLRVKAVR